MHPYKDKHQDKVGHSRAKELISGYARGGKVIININPKSTQAEPPTTPPPPMAPPGLAAAPPGVPPVPPGGGGPLPPMPMRARGGKVSMTGGAETGVGRLDKKKAYGVRARSG